MIQLNSKQLFLRFSIAASLSIFSLLFSQSSIAESTPSDVYHKVSMINSDLVLIRKKLDIKEKPREPAVQTNKKPVHVYSKGIELIDKIARLQKEHGITPTQVPSLPFKKITPTDVFELVEDIHTELLKVKQKIGVTKEIEAVEFVQNRTPSNVYENIWIASYMIDGMIKPITPVEVFKNTKRVQGELALVANHLKVTLPEETPARESGKRPKQVNLQGYINLHKLSVLEKQLKMSIFRVPPYPRGKMSPSDVYDTTNMLLAELNRIKVFLNIRQETVAPEVNERKRPSHVYAEMVLMNDQIDILAQASK